MLYALKAMIGVYLIKDDEMIIISGEKYLREKEIASKYGLSTQWFRRARYSNNSPVYHKLHGKIYYKEENVEQWFKEKLRDSH
jgi:predicted DNA-binding transcriptional regulator AlpA